MSAIYSMLCSSRNGYWDLECGVFPYIMLCWASSAYTVLQEHTTSSYSFDC